MVECSPRLTVDVPRGTEVGRAVFAFLLVLVVASLARAREARRAFSMEDRTSSFVSPP